MPGRALRHVAGTRCSARRRRCTRPPACLCQVFPLYIAVIVQHAIFSAAATELSNVTDEAALLARPVHRDALANLRHALAARLLQRRLGCSRWRRLADGLVGLHVLLVGTGHRVRPPLGVAGHHEPIAEAPGHPGCCTTQARQAGSMRFGPVTLKWLFWRIMNSTSRIQATLRTCESSGEVCGCNAVSPRRKDHSWTQCSHD